MTKPPRTRSDRQKAASRANGAKGRGPRSAKGKQKSARNAQTHGLTGATLELDDAETKIIDGLKRKLLRRYDLSDPNQAMLIELVMTSSIRLARVRALITDRLVHTVLPECSQITVARHRGSDFMLFIHTETRKMYGDPVPRSLLKPLAEMAGHKFDTDHRLISQLPRLAYYAQRFGGERDRALRRLEKLRLEQG